jgi:hypothetical protein
MANSKTIAGLIGPTLIALAAALLINLGSISTPPMNGRLTPWTYGSFRRNKDISSGSVPIGSAV